MLSNHEGPEEHEEKSIQLRALRVLVVETDLHG
jgi:hypothetical protein